MKIIYLTDIHDALKGLRCILQNTQADLYIISGDILYKAFYEEETIYNFVCLQEELYQLVRQLKLDLYPIDLATDILRSPEKYIDSAESQKKELWQEKAQTYRQLFETAAKTMREKYTLIRDLIEKYAKAQVWMLPGNYDIDLHYTDLSEHNLHNKVKYKRTLKFAGYGGAPVQTSGIPEKLAITYHEHQKDGQLYSEPLHFFQEEQPDVLVLHNPVYGYFDRIPGIGNVGSQGIRTYLDEHQPLLVLSGHVHEDYGVASNGKTIFLNPSNFGGVDSPQGWQEGGYYAEIYLKNNAIDNIVFMQLTEEKILSLMQVKNKPQGLIREVLPEAKHSKTDTHLDLDLLLRDACGKAIA